MPNWRIDTLDARGGLAFTSFRNSDFAPERFQQGSRPPCMFLGPPDFQPEPITNRSIALSASRGCFQTGMFLDGSELTFETLQEVAEFVRRAYLSGGGGDGADGGGGEGPPPGPGEPPDLPRTPVFGGEGFRDAPLRKQLQEALLTFDRQSKSLNPGETSDAQHIWPGSIDFTDARAGGSRHVVDNADMLAAAAVRLLYEIVRRLPASRAPAALTRWSRDSQRFGAVLARLDLWPALLAPPYRGALEKLSEALNKRGLLIVPDVSDRNLKLQIAFAIMISWFMEGYARDAEESRWPYLEDWWYTALLHPIVGQSVFDPISDLCHIPVPADLQTCASGLNGEASLYHLLSTFVGTPLSAIKGGEVLLDIVLFASAVLTGPDRGWPFSLRRRHWRQPIGGGQALTSTERAAIQGNANRAWNWLKEQLPAFVFPAQIELAIGSTADVRYLSGRDTRDAQR